MPASVAVTLLLPHFTPATVSAVGWLPVALVFAAQWRGSDKLWTLANVHHTLFTRIPSLAICAVLLPGIPAWRWQRSVTQSRGTYPDVS